MRWTIHRTLSVAAPMEIFTKFYRTLALKLPASPSSFSTKGFGTLKGFSIDHALNCPTGGYPATLILAI